jgi:transmembrane sensor
MLLPKDNFTVEELICNESFQQYCLGSSLESQIIWQEFIQTHSGRLTDFEEAKHIVHLLSAKQGNKHHQLQELKSGLQQRETLNNLLAQPKDHQLAIVSSQKSKFIYKYISIAAAITVALLISIYFIIGPYNGAVKTSFTAGAKPETSSNSQLRKTIILSDGTVVTLAANSAVRLSDDFSAIKRELWITGEAFFDVQHDKQHPFIVHTPLNDVRVLGTVFNIKAYSNKVETSLISGSVRVDLKDKPGHSILLKPYQKLITTNGAANSGKEFTNSNAVITIAVNRKGAAVPQEILWVANRLEIENEPLASIAEKLQAWYGIEITINDEAVKQYRYSGIFESETILKTLEALQLSYPFTFKTEQNRIILSK